MSAQEALKLTIYFGERDRAGSALLADALCNLYERHDLALSVLLRGIEGFGLKHHLHTDRFLTLSEDLPAVSVAVDTRDRIEALLPEAFDMLTHGLLTVERARLLGPEISLAEEHDDPVKLTVYCGRYERSGNVLTYRAVVELLHRRGVAGATVLLGVDGTIHRTRQRARLLGRNTDVPLMIIAVGERDAIARAVEDLPPLLARPLVTAERVQVCKRDGALITRPRPLPETGHSGLPVWQKLMVYASEQSRYESHPLHVELIRRLREAGAAGATAVRGIWGYHGDHAPHGDRPFSLVRQVPVVTVLVDTPDRIQRWWEIVDEVTGQTGLVTSEMVPAAHARAPGVERGGTGLSALH